jgi:hypothetical protein
MTKERSQRSNSFSEITPAPDTTHRQEQLEATIDITNDLEGMPTLVSSIAPHQEEQASSGNKSRSCLNSILDRTPISFLENGIWLSSLTMLTSAGVLLFNDHSDYISSSGTNKTIEHEHRIESTDEFTRAFASLMVLSTLSCFSFYKLYNVKNAKQKEEQKSQTSKDAKEVKQEEEEEKNQRKKEKLLSISPHEFSQYFSALSSTFSQEQKIDVLRDFVEKNKSPNARNAIFELTKSEILKMDSTQFSKAFEKLFHHFTGEQQIEFSSIFLTKEGIQTSENQTESIAKARFLKSLGEFSSNFSLDTPMDQKINTLKDFLKTNDGIIKNDKKIIDYIFTITKSKIPKMDSDQFPEAFKILSPYFTEQQKSEFLREFVYKMDSTEFRNFFGPRHHMFHPNEKEIIVREHLQHQKNNANSSTEIKPSPEPRITSTQPQEASLMRNETELRRGVHGGGVYSMNREGSERV